MNDFDTFTKISQNVEDLGKLLVAKGLKKLSKVQKIANSGHTELDYSFILTPANSKQVSNRK